MPKYVKLELTGNLFLILLLVATAYLIFAVHTLDGKVDGLVENHALTAQPEPPQED